MTIYIVTTGRQPPKFQWNLISFLAPLEQTNKHACSTFSVNNFVDYEMTTEFLLVLNLVLEFSDTWP